jgi:hypothetical protein
VYLVRPTQHGYTGIPDIKRDLASQSKTGLLQVAENASKNVPATLKSCSLADIFWRSQHA